MTTEPRPLYIDGKSWRIEDLKTLEDVERAEDYIVEALNRIKTALQLNTTDMEWRAKALSALGIKKHIRQRIQQRGRELRLCEKKVTHLLRVHHPALYEELVQQAEAA